MSNQEKKLPMGIRKRGNAYQVIVTRHSRQYSATFNDLDQAVKWRHEKIEELNSTRPPKEGAATITFEQAVKKTIETRWEGTKAERTSVLNANTLMRFFGPQTKLTSITTEEVERLISDQKRKSLSNGTINRKLACLSVILKTAEDFGYKTGNPKLIRRKEYKGRDRFLTDEEEKQMIQILTQLGQEEHLDAFLLLLDAGIRVGELLKLQYRDIDFTQGKYGVLHIWKAKNDHPRTVPLTKRVREILVKKFDSSNNNKFDSSNKKDAPLFPGLTPDTIRGVWGRLRYIMRLDDDPQFVPHILRHTCASRLVQKGVPLAMVQQWLGHRSIQSTMRYAHLAPTALFEYVE